MLPVEFETNFFRDYTSSLVTTVEDGSISYSKKFYGKGRGLSQKYISLSLESTQLHAAARWHNLLVNLNVTVPVTVIMMPVVSNVASARR